MTLAKLDATVAKDTAAKYSVQGFPTIKLFRGGEASEYNGGRTEKEIVAWATKKSGPAFLTLTTTKELEELQEKHEAFVVGYYSDLTSEHAEGLKKLAIEVDDGATIALTSSSEIKSKLALTKDTVVVLKKFDDKRNDLVVEADFDLADVRSFIMGSITPLIQYFSPETANKIFSNKITKHIMYFTDKTADYHEGLEAKVRPVAEAFKGKFLCVHMPSSEDRVLEYFGIKKEDLPLVYVIDMASPSGMKKYPFSGELETTAIQSFVQAVSDGTVSPVLKSEDLAPEDTTGDVVVLKGKSFNELVLENTKDVFVEFYAPW